MTFSSFMCKKINTDFFKRGFKWKSAILRIRNSWGKFVKKDSHRLTGGFTLSLIIHVFAILSYFGLATLDRPVEIPIREISFIDLTEETIPEVESPNFLIPKRKEDTPSNQTEEQIVLSQNREELSQRKIFGEDKIYLDAPRKQAPINLERVKPIAKNVINPGDLLTISPANGTGNEKRVARPVQIKLDKSKQLTFVSNVKSENTIKSGTFKGSKINLTKAVFQRPVKSSVGQLKSTPLQMDLSKTGVKPKQTEMLITGQLADRSVLKKSIPSFPRWAKRRGVGATISLRFTVMESGIVKENVIIERTSGSGEWDHMVVQALKQWQFAILEKRDVRHDQTGVITFHFVI